MFGHHVCALGAAGKKNCADAQVQASIVRGLVLPGLESFDGSCRCWKGILVAFTCHSSIVGLFLLHTMIDLEYDICCTAAIVLIGRLLAAAGGLLPLRPPPGIKS